jgi:hypothetical protein
MKEYIGASRMVHAKSYLCNYCSRVLGETLKIYVHSHLFGWSADFIREDFRRPHSKNRVLSFIEWNGRSWSKHVPNLPDQVYRTYLKTNVILT